MGRGDPQLSDPRPDDPLLPRWRGQGGRLEAWYVTWSDPATTGAGWVHHEIVAPPTGGAQALGWAVLFRAGRPPVAERFGPHPVVAGDGGRWPSVPEATFEPPVVAGAAGRLGWDLRLGPDGARPLYTFGRVGWERELLPAAQVVPVPDVAIHGTVHLDGAARELSARARGNAAHIYGRGNAERWAWLHADLGGGDVLEVVSAVGRHGPMRRLPPLTFVQLRTAGVDWPRDPVVTAPLFRARLGLPAWRVRGRVGRWRLTVDVTLDPDRSTAVAYTDPDGSPATCTNSEMADATVVLEQRGRSWQPVARWRLVGTAHAEVGTRPGPGRAAD